MILRLATGRRSAPTFILLDTTGVRFEPADRYQPEEFDGRACVASDSPYRYLRPDPAQNINWGDDANLTAVQAYWDADVVKHRAEHEAHEADKVDCFYRNSYAIIGHGETADPIALHATVDEIWSAIRMGGAQQVEHYPKDGE